VGRGVHESHCILISDARAPETKVRLQAMTETTDGFILAERDLEQRGGGDFFGTRQHGLPAFKIANLYRDGEILKEAQQAALDYIKNKPTEGNGFELLVNRGYSGVL
jgi:ATP-dependent DNA helicase RecG